MGYFENGFLGNPNSSKAKIKGMLDVMDEEQLKLTLSRAKEAFPDVEKKAQEERLERIEGNLNYFEAQIHELDNSRERMNDALYGTKAAIRRLNVAFIALAVGLAAIIAVLTTLSLV